MVRPGSMTKIKPLTTRFSDREIITNNINMFQRLNDWIET